MPNSTASFNHSPLSQPPLAAPVAQRGSLCLQLSPYTVDLRYTLTEGKLTLKGQLRSEQFISLPKNTYLILYSTSGWVVDFVQIDVTGRFCFSPAKQRFYSVTLSVFGEEYLLGALEL
jgi:hypothetical protein